MHVRGDGSTAGAGVATPKMPAAPVDTPPAGARETVTSELMKLESAVRIMAGTMVLLSISLAHWVDHRWLFLTAFVGFNLIQSAITGFCPAEIIFRKLGIGKGGSCCS